MAYKKSLKIIKTKILEKEKAKKAIKRYFYVPPIEDEYQDRMDSCYYK